MISTDSPHTLDPEKLVWDVLVVGTGMGGATLGYALARSGQRVLFVEQGTSSVLRPDEAVRGRFPEEAFAFSGLARSRQQEILARAGRSTVEVEDVSRPGVRRYSPFLGSGTGGSSALYGMVLERFLPADFAPQGNVAEAGESTLPESWPISYDDLSPWYRAAELLYRVRGSADPLRPAEEAEHLPPPPPLSEPNAELFQFLRRRGLHPYQLHVACEYLPGCRTCQGYLCHQPCKNDAGRICLLPAVTEYGAQLLTGCRAVRLEASRTAVEKVVCDWQGRPLTLQAKLVVLAAGALATPLLLLRSASAAWPNGLANGSGLVGRNLMRHFIIPVLVVPRTKSPPGPLFKEIAFNDLYRSDGRKFGAVQSFGLLPPLEVFMGFLGPRAGRLRALKPVVAPLWRRLASRSLVLAGIMEDLPYLDNYVLPAGKLGEDGSNGLRLHYRVRESERLRVLQFRAALKRLLRPYRIRISRGPESNTGLAHVCGTCRFGSDPRTSVLDSSNRAHELSNLYVVDGSFFPSSGGVNPALTIAANALRVADHLERERL